MSDTTKRNKHLRSEPKSGKSAERPSKPRAGGSNPSWRKASSPRSSSGSSPSQNARDSRRGKSSDSLPIHVAESEEAVLNLRLVRGSHGVAVEATGPGIEAAGTGPDWATACRELALALEGGSR